MTAKLIVDLTKVGPQGDSSIRCSYKHHPGNRGIDALLEQIRFALICRRCENAPCVRACPRGALEQVTGAAPDGRILKRANMLCSGCGTCVLACPFGTVYPDLVTFTSSTCDLCRGRLRDGQAPLCAESCTDGSIRYGPVPPGEGLVEIIDGVVVVGADDGTWKPFLRHKQEAKP